MVDLESIFIACNIEDPTASTDQQSLNVLNADHGLMRFEFLQALTRVSIAKYVRPGLLADVSSALEKLIHHDVAPRVPAAARHDSDVFRRARLYTTAVSDLLVRHEPQLRVVYDYYSTTDALRAPRPGASADAERALKEATGGGMSLTEWIALLTDAGLLRDDGRDDHFSAADARLCLVWSQTFVSDELKRRSKLASATYVDFVEALGRLCTFKPLPSRALLAQYGASSAHEFYAAMEAGEHLGSVLVKTGHLAPVSWEEQESCAEPLDEPLGVLIELLLDRLDTDADGTVTRREMEAKRMAMAGKKRRVSRHGVGKAKFKAPPVR